MKNYEQAKIHWKQNGFFKSEEAVKEFITDSRMQKYNPPYRILV